MSEAEGVAERASQRSPRLIDALLGAMVTVTVSAVITADVTGSGPDARAYLWAVGLGALMLIRRRYPALVVALSVAGLIAYYSAGLPPIGVAVPVAAAVFSAAEVGRPVVAVIGSCAVLAVSTSYRLLVGQDPSYVLYELAGHVLLLAAAVALGDSLRSRRKAQDRADEVVALEAERHRRATEARLTAERLTISRDLHDSLGHLTSVVALHAQVAAEAIGHDDAGARRALTVVSATATTMMTELRRTVAVLRDREDRHDVTRLQDLEGAVLPARQVGLPVAVNADRLPPRLPEPVQTAAYRIIKEAVVNVTRHSRATRVDVDVHVRGDTLHLRVADDGPSRCSPGRAGDHAPGFGIVGMRERAESLGGTLTAGPVGDGFVVDARLPVEPSS